MKGKTTKRNDRQGRRSHSREVVCEIDLSAFSMSDAGDFRANVKRLSATANQIEWHLKNCNCGVDVLRVVELARRARDEAQAVIDDASGMTIRAIA